MQYTTLGRTGLKVSVAGLGCGGFSKLGLGTGHSAEHAVGIIRQALDLGVNLIDTAAAYGTEEWSHRPAWRAAGQVVVCTKASKPAGDTDIQRGQGDRQPGRVVEAPRPRLRRRLPASRRPARRLRPCPRHDRPALLKERDKGKIRFLGITETAPNDPEQHMLNRAMQDDCGTPPWWPST